MHQSNYCIHQIIVRQSWLAIAITVSVAIVTGLISIYSYIIQSPHIM
jgi:hypothetical protein